MLRLVHYGIVATDASVPDSGVGRSTAAPPPWTRIRCSILVLVRSYREHKSLRERAARSRRRGERRRTIRRSRAYLFGVESRPGRRKRGRPSEEEEQDDVVPPLVADGVVSRSLARVVRSRERVQHRARQAHDRHSWRDEVHHL
ncbi:hypothetical protein M407DRAFT_29628 [Tulasnella calospora MUT 4182]|uniref:Uncharacterized protein n=1 Tax=Tulasnella calospora MUT 4182 TaxID=1051891 RepID=A0A0C3KGV1_9AGAM|nr:hypothetical protein M407DRAFT_29628 [Tulasnella calospora MUT 4182]